jgi:hypothetical protein
MANRRDILKAAAVAPLLSLGGLCLPQGAAATVAVPTPRTPPTVYHDVTESRAVVFRCGDYPAKGFSITPAEFVAANPPGTEVAFCVEGVGEGSMLWEPFSGIAHSFDLIGDEVHCTITHRPFLGAILRETRSGFAAYFSKSSRRLIRIVATEHPTIEGTGIIDG